MKLDRRTLSLYIITDRTWSLNNDFYLQVEESLKGGATFLQFREKNISFDEFVLLGLKIKEIANKYNVPFVINDNVDVAIAVGADGVHIGQSDCELANAREKLGINKIIGMSVQTVSQAIEAEENGADYLGVGAMFETSTKVDAELVSFETLKNICKAVKIPVVAIGGINKNNLHEVLNSGVCGACFISAVFAQNDIYVAVKKLKEMIL